MAKKSAFIFGVIFVIIGILGFISNPIVGAEGYFLTGTVLNIIHLLVGIKLIAVTASDKSGLALKLIGIAYLLGAILGFVSGTSVLGLFAVNDADNWLHLVLGVVIFVLGFSGGRGTSTPAPVQPMQSM